MLRKLLSVILVLILFPLVVGQITASAARSLLSDSVFTKEVMRESGIYTEMEAFLVDQLSEGFQRSAIQFTRAEVYSIVTGALPASRLQAVSEAAIEGLHKWFWSGASRPDVVIDLTGARRALPSVIRPIIVAKVEALPVCTAAQAAQLALSYSGGMPPCKSPNATFNKMVIDRAVSDADLENLMPARVDLAAELEMSNGPDFWRELSADIRSARLGLDMIPFGWGLIAILLALVALLNLDRWYTPFGWVAAPLLAGGSVLLLVGLVGVNLAVPMLRGTVVTGDAEGAFAISVMRAAVETLFISMRTISMIVALTGLGCVIVAVAGRMISPPGPDPRTTAA